MSALLSNGVCLRLLRAPGAGGASGGARGAGSLLDRRPLGEAGGAVILGGCPFDPRHVGHGGAAAAGFDEAFDGCRLAGDLRLDAAIAQIAHPAAQAAPARFAPRPGTKADALDKAANE